MAVQPGDILRVDFVGHDTTEGQDLVNVFHFKHDSIVSHDEEDVMSDFETWAEDYAAVLAPAVCAAYNFDFIRVVNETRGTDVGLYNLTTTVAGSATGATGANILAAILNFSTDVLRTVGRKYISPLSETDTEGNHLTSGATTRLVAVVAAIIEVVVGVVADYEPGVMSGVDELWHAFEGGDVSTYLGKQGRRRPSVGS